MAKAVSQMNKAELVREAQRLGVDVEKGENQSLKQAYEAQTVEDLREKVREAREQDNPTTPTEERGASASSAEERPIARPVGGGSPNTSGGGFTDPNPASGLHSGPGAGPAPGQETPSTEEAVEQLGAGLTPAEDARQEPFADGEAAAAGPLTVENTIRRRRATEADPERMGMVLEVANSLADLSFDELTRLQTAVSSALTGRGKEPEPEPVSELALAQSLPRHHQATLEADLDAVVEAVRQDPNAPSNLQANDVLNYAVKQAQNAAGKGIGPRYAIVALTDTRKLAGRL